METKEYLEYKYLIEAENKKWCYDCEYFFYSQDMSYNSCNCEIYGMIDCNQNKIHPDEYAKECEHYKRSKNPLWFYKYINAYDALRLGLIKEENNKE